MLFKITFHNNNLFLGVHEYTHNEVGIQYMQRNYIGKNTCMLHCFIRLRYISPKAISPKGRFAEKLARIMNNSTQNYIFGEMTFGEMSGYRSEVCTSLTFQAVR